MLDLVTTPSYQASMDSGNASVLHMRYLVALQ